MLVHKVGEGLRLVRQNDHARLSGRLAELWGGGPWAMPVPHREMALGAALHDLAWTAWDEQPALREDGTPLAFYEVPRTITAPMYERGIDAVQAIDARAGLLVSLHYSGLFTSHWGWEPLADMARMSPQDREAVERFLENERERQGLLGIDVGDRHLECAYKWLQLWDRISLDVCRHDFDEGWSGGYPPVPVGAKGPDVTLSIRLEPPNLCLLEPYPLTLEPALEAVPAVIATPAELRARGGLLSGLREDRLEVVFRAG